LLATCLTLPKVIGRRGYGRQLSASCVVASMDTVSDPDCYWVEPGRLLAGEYPGAADVEAARAKLRALLECGIRTFIDLTEQDELEPYAGLLEEEARAMGTAVVAHRFPVRDLGVPGDGVMRKIIAAIHDAIADGSPVYVHCWGGIGRTGTVVGCWLVEAGMSGTDALRAMTRLREKSWKYRLPSPETAAQRDFVCNWLQPPPAPR
jgi:hypothetical protein